MSIADIKLGMDQKMVKAIDSLKNNLAKVRTGRAHVGILDHVQVDYYGSSVPISQVANITLVDSRTLGVSPWEKKMVQAVDKAIRDSDLGLNPSVMGDLIRVPMPALSEERRKELIKLVKNEGEQSKVVIRNLRRDANAAVKELVKSKEASEDDDRRSQDDVQKLTDRYIHEVDSLLQLKEQELLTI
jgi:ribosome recycling factor